MKEENGSLKVESGKWKIFMARIFGLRAIRGSASRFIPQLKCWGTASPPLLSRAGIFVIIKHLRAVTGKDERSNVLYNY